MSAFDKEFGAALRREREGSGMSLRTASEALIDYELPIDPTVLSRIENGTRPARLEEATAFAEMFGGEVTTIMTRGHKMSTRAEKRAAAQRTLANASIAARDEEIASTAAGEAHWSPYDLAREDFDAIKTIVTETPPAQDPEEIKAAIEYLLELAREEQGQ